jgi:hypothetical protein
MRRTVTQESGDMTDTSIEVSVSGVWSRVPALDIEGKHITVRGTFLRQAVVDAEEWQETGIEDPELCIRMLKERRIGRARADIFTFTQKPPDATPRYGYGMSWDSVAIVRTTPFKAWWDALPQEGRKNVRRSQKRGVVVSVKPLDDALIRDIVELNNDSSVRQGRRYAHFGKTFEQVKKDQSTYLDRSDFICAYWENELVGFIKVVYRGDVASILQILPKASHADKRPANALLAKTIELCESKGISYLTYGMFNYGNKRESPLREFKERNGFEEMLVPRYYVPLTWKGKLYFKLNIHRGLLGCLPSGVITIAVRARARWYDFVRLISRCSSKAERPNRNRQMECSNPPAGSNS